MELIKLNKLEIGWDNKAIISDINLSINSGEFLVILGHNGSGKTTLLNTILGLQKPIKGNVEFLNGIRKGVGYLPQQTEIQKDFPSTVNEIVLSGTSAKSIIKPFYTRRDKELADLCLDKVGISEIKNESYKELSGGQQQRVLIARALASTGKILFLDEPTSGLDEATSEALYSILSDLNKQDSIAIVLISHDSKKALSYASHVLELKHGKYSYKEVENV